jgi:CxxC motif-containing protein (DUF1111 family)
MRHATGLTLTSLGLVLAAALALDARGAEDVSTYAPDELAPLVEGEELLGGAASVDDDGQNAFSYPARVLTAKERRAFAVGNAFFKDNWVMAPASAAGRDGLGPLFNARSCSGCHLRDGRGRPLLPGETASAGLLLRLGVPGESSDLPHPIYGGQLQEYAVHGVPAEASFSIRLTAVSGVFGDGQTYELEAPHYEITDPAFGPLGEDLRVGARVAPQMIGLGLLEAVPESALVALADPDDADGDGISGRAHMVHSLRHDRAMIGRFGWKATQPTVEEQVAGAFVNDIGITSVLHRNEVVTGAEREQIEFASGGAPEMSEHKLQRVTYYSQTLAVPVRRHVADPTVRRGKLLFDEIGCAACHVSELRTGTAYEIPAYRDQLIRPYTDLLLHDMGVELADTKHDGAATPREWRTPPLWGIGLIDEVNGHTRFLHDGRARNLSEAVLWHGGEGEESRERYRKLSARDRNAVIAFLESL